jgi:hypothetical protein
MRLVYDIAAVLVLFLDVLAPVAALGGALISNLNPGETAFGEVPVRCILGGSADR